MTRSRQKIRSKPRAKRTGAKNALAVRVPDPSRFVRYLHAFEAGLSITPDEALKVAAAWACIDVIVRAIAPRPWNVFELQGRKRILRPDDPLEWQLNTRPNPDTTAIAFREALLRTCMAGDGNAYAEIQFDGAGRPVALWPLDASVVPRRDAAGVLYYDVNTPWGQSVDVESWRIFHLRGPCLSAYIGDNVLARASRSLAIAAAAQTFSASYFANGLVSTGVLKHPKTVKEPAIKRLRQEWMESHVGPGAAHAPLFLEDGMEWQTIQVDADKAQLLGTREFQIAEAARWWGVPLHKLQVAASAQGYGTNVAQLDLVFVRDTLIPWTTRLEQEGDYKFFPQRAPWRRTKIDLSLLTQGDFKSRMEGYAVGKKAGIMSQNEAREMEGWNTTGPEGDVYLVESTMTTVERILEPPEPAPKQLPAPAPLESSDDPAEEGPLMNETAREAVALVFASALERYGRAIKNRRADLEKNAPDKVDTNLATERERLRSRLAEDCADAIGLLRKMGGAGEASLVATGDAVEAGEPPRLAAERYVSTLLDVASASPLRMEAA